VSLASFKSRPVLPFWYQLTQVVLEKRLLNGCSRSSSCVVYCYMHWSCARFYLNCREVYDNFRAYALISCWSQLHVACRLWCRFIVVWSALQLCYDVIYVCSFVQLYFSRPILCVWDIGLVCNGQCRIKVGVCYWCCSIRPIQQIGPRPQTRKRDVFPVLVVISLVGTISRKSLKLLPPDVLF